LFTFYIALATSFSGKEAKMRSGEFSISTTEYRSIEGKQDG
jgi:hypothetical protein